MDNRTRVLTIDEVRQIVAWHRVKRRINQKRRLAIFRLSACCGLRRSEISGLNISDLFLVGPKPNIRVRRETTKRKLMERRVPLWWDAGTFEDLADWREMRLALDKKDGPLIVVTTNDRWMQRCNPPMISKQWWTAIKNVLGEERARQVSIHGGRHTFASYAHAAGVSLANMRDVLGHKSIATTSIYLQGLEQDDISDLFA